MTESHLLATGEFARESGLSRKALRLYDDSGLLSPAQVDRVTGYRYYTPGQIGRARHISLLRRLGMPLVRVATILEHSGSDSVASVVNRLTAWWEGEEQAFAERRATVEYLLRVWSDLTSVAYSVESRHVSDCKLATTRREVLQPVETMIDLVGGGPCSHRRLPRTTRSAARSTYLPRPLGRRPRRRSGRRGRPALPTLHSLTPRGKEPR